MKFFLVTVLLASAYMTVSGIPMRYASEIETINESLYCINDAINEAFSGSDVEEKWDQLLNTELKDISEKFAECSGNGVAADSFHCVLTYAYELNQAIENFFETLGNEYQEAYLQLITEKCA